MAQLNSPQNLARCQLGLSSFVTVPKEYLQELKTHVATAPNDVNFRVETAPGTGYGVAICLETLCKKQKAQIPLTRNAKLPDGGKSIGVGALSEYRIHCASEQHARSRSARLRDSRNETTKSSVTKGTATGSLVTSVKKEPTPAYKRAYDFIYDTGEQSTSKPPAGSPPKKIKTESFSSPAPKVHKPPQPSVQEQEEITALRDEIDSLKESMTVIQGLIQDIENKAIGGPDTIPLEDRVDMEQYLRDLEGYELRWASCEEKLAAVQRNVGKKRIIPSSSESDIAPNVASSSSVVPSRKRALPSSWSSSSTAASSSRRVQSSSVKRTIPRARTMPCSESRSTASSVYTPCAVALPAAIPLPFIGNRIDPLGVSLPPVPSTKPEPKAKPEDLLDFIISSSNSKDVASSSLTDALRQLGLGNVNEVLPGMGVPLHPHQVIGVAWMIEREASEERKVRGGMLADEMGLGKTVQMTALIVSRPSSNKRPTLVVLPLNIMNQWKKELEDKSGGGLKCGVYHGNKRKLFQAVEDFKAYDVVLTTYQTMSREWSADPKHRRPGLLFQVKFHRIVLDESQMMRTKETITSRAVASLQGRYKWCLTGTPIINCLEDLFPFFRFLGIQPFCDYSVYRTRISVLEKNDPQQATQRLQAVLNDFLLRRRKDAMMNGRKLVDLPKKNVDLVSLKFSPKEREIYDMFERRAQGIMRGFIKTQTVARNTNNMLVELLRLRQMCTHPALVKELDLEQFESDVKGKGKASSKDSELARAERLLGPQFITKMQEKLLREEREAVAGDMEAPDATSLNEEECPICYDVYTDAVVTSCGHSFCRECIMSALTSGPCPEDMKRDERPCPSCRSKISPTLLFPRSIFKLAQRQKEGMEDDDAAMLDVEALMPVFTPSTKMTWMLGKIKELVQTRPNEKLLVISQWTECLALVSGYLDKQGIGYVKYQGGMNQRKRDQALAQFDLAGTQARVLLLSMKAGGVGLNLTRANNIISLDLGWSRAVEEQAFDRVHRMTQEREVHVSRLVIENTVEDRILRLQERKQSLADGSLGEGAGSKRIKKLTVEDWANLFGLDARGNRLAG